MSPAEIGAGARDNPTLEPMPRAGTLNGCSDKVGREECERDNHIELPNAALLAAAKLCDGSIFGWWPGCYDTFYRSSASRNDRPELRFGVA